ncbi:MAG TPA: IclR family transcriptional regulator C-terminal domain-containing protein [Pseudomonadota bacterium]|nr:IclR family transcriptional regulator C-terminal domain-containing protein [Pseudomonadota bacterium]
MLDLRPEYLLLRGRMNRRLTAAEVERGASSAPAARAQPPSLFDHDVLAVEAIARFDDDPDFVTALDRGLAILLVLSDKKRRMSISQVSHRTGIPRAAARRSLHTLECLGFVAADEARHFYLRPRVLSFSHAYLAASPLAVLAQPILDRLGETLHEACSLAILDGEEIVYLARSATSRIMSPALNVGRRLPAYCTSIGQVLLAYLPPEELEAYFARAHFHPYTEYTLTSADRLHEALEAVRSNGVAFASQQMERRLSTIAVPVRDAGGHYVAGMNVILHGRLLSIADMTERFYRPLHDAAMELGSLILG